MQNLNSENLIPEILKRSGFEKLNPVQQLSVDNDLLTSANQVVAAATASGKTLIAEIAALNAIRRGKKVVFIVPLKALASEKFEDFKKKYESLGVRVAMSIGDYDRGETWLANFDLIICTSEKLDSLLRHGIEWMNDVGLVIVDEIHLLGTSSRGATLEMVLTRLRQKISPEVLGLSATISNYEELAGWLSAKPLKSSWRPVKLYKGVSFGKIVDFKPEYTMNLKEDGINGLIQDTIEQNKQALVFVSSRRNAEAAAEQFGRIFLENTRINQNNDLEKIAGKAQGTLEKSSKQCRRLAKCISMGTAFHHAGLLYNQRKLVEDSFKAGRIKIIVATPTLAWGVNLPASRVIVRDLKRFSMGLGMAWIPIMDVEQMCGRAGRPQYDTEGQAILVARNDRDTDYIWENYINGETEKINSQLGDPSILRTHVLALIAGDIIKNRSELSQFFEKTFLAHQATDMYSFEENLDSILEQLEQFGFIVRREQSLSPTKIGKRISELYIDPVSAHHIIFNFQKASSRKAISDFAWLHMISCCVEMSPLLRINKKDWQWIEKALLKEEPWLLQSAPDTFTEEYENYLEGIKTAQVFAEWAEERSEDFLLEKFGMTPGELRSRIETLDWLFYASLEFSKMLPGFLWTQELRKMRTRIMYGIKEELLSLVRIKGIGRVRARKLFKAGIKKPADLRKVNNQNLGKILGPRVAINIKKDLLD
jgi:helicase